MPLFLMYSCLKNMSSGWTLHRMNMMKICLRHAHNKGTLCQQRLISRPGVHARYYHNPLPQGRMQQNIVAVGSLLLLLGGTFTYVELQSLRENLRLTNSIVDIQRGREDYIYVNKDVLRADDNLQGKMKKLKKWKRLWFPWLQSRSHNAWTLLQLARSEDHSVRLLGVRALAADHGWSDAEFQMLSQALDDRTMVGLARTPHADLRFFRRPPRLPPSKESMEERLRKLLVSLPTDGVDRCTLHFTSQVLDEAHNQATKEERGGLWCFGGTGLAFPQMVSPVPDEVVELYCLQAMARHSRVASHCPKIVELGGLQLLQELYQERSGKMKITRNIARILANCSLHKCLHPHIIQAGWVSLLVEWARSSDLALSMHAAKTLANLDTDFGPKDYMDGVYLYYPQHRYSEPVYADIVFVHGLLGGPFRTWRQGDPPPPRNNTVPVQQTQVANDSTNTPVKGYSKENSKAKPHYQSNDVQITPKDFSFCWPKDWLAKDCPHVRILTVEYESHLSEWAPKCPYESEKRSLLIRSIELLEKLQQAGVGDRPIIWVGHSMGGLIIKQILAMAQHDQKARRLLKHSLGIVFYSVPHRGAPLAAYGNHTKYIFYPSVEVKELNTGCEKLLKLHHDFTEQMFDTGIPLLTFGEGQKTQLPFNFKVLMVPQESSDPGFGEYHFMEDYTHLNICKPESKQSPLYQLTLEFIRACLPIPQVKKILRANIPEEYILPQDVDS